MVSQARSRLRYVHHITRGGDLHLPPTGLRRPHLPWAVPEKVARRVPPAEAIAIARHPTAACGAPAIAYFNCLNEGKCVRADLAPEEL